MSITKEIEERARKKELNINDFIQYRQELEELELLKEEFFDEEARMFLKENYQPKINFIGNFFDMDKEKSCDLYSKYPWIFSTPLKSKYKENEYLSMIKDISVEDFLGLLILMEDASIDRIYQMLSENENVIENNKTNDNKINKEIGE